jgi:hypothetical protein
MLTAISHGHLLVSADFLDCGVVLGPESSKTLLQDVMFLEDLRVDICNGFVDIPRSKGWIENPQASPCTSCVEFPQGLVVKNLNLCKSASWW